MSCCWVAHYEYLLLDVIHGKNTPEFFFWWRHKISKVLQPIQYLLQIKNSDQQEDRQQKRWPILVRNCGHLFPFPLHIPNITCDVRTLSDVITHPRIFDHHIHPSKKIPPGKVRVLFLFQQLSRKECLEKNGGVITLDDDTRHSQGFFHQSEFSFTKVHTLGTSRFRKSRS